MRACARARVCVRARACAKYISGRLSPAITSERTCVLY